MNNGTCPYCHTPCALLQESSGQTPLTHDLLQGHFAVCPVLNASYQGAHRLESTCQLSAQPPHSINAQKTSYSKLSHELPASSLTVATSSPFSRRPANSSDSLSGAQCGDDVSPPNGFKVDTIQYKSRTQHCVQGQEQAQQALLPQPQDRPSSNQALPQMMPTTSWLQHQQGSFLQQFTHHQSTARHAAGVETNPLSEIQRTSADPAGFQHEEQKSNKEAPRSSPPSQPIQIEPHPHQRRLKPLSLLRRQEMTFEGTTTETGGGHHAHESIGSRVVEARAKNIQRRSDSVVTTEDKTIITDYIYFLHEQLKICHFAERDRKIRGGKRNSIKIGYGGLECRHCALRRFFWSDVDRFANSFAEIPGHIMKCPMCPQEIKIKLQQLKSYHPQQMTEFPRGSQKIFFRRLWRKLHPEEDCVSGASGVAAEYGSVPGLSLRREVATGQSGTKSVAMGVPLASRVLLASDEDNKWLSDMDCFARRTLEVFCASETDARNHYWEHAYHIEVGQVGIRCIYCASSTEGATGSSVSYPSSIHWLHKAVQTHQRLHLHQCKHFPPEERHKLSQLGKCASLPSVLKRYYAISAKAIGLYDSDVGIRVETRSIPDASSEFTQSNTAGREHTKEHMMCTQAPRYRSGSHSLLEGSSNLCEQTGGNLMRKDYATTEDDTDEKCSSSKKSKV